MDWATSSSGPIMGGPSADTGEKREPRNDVKCYTSRTQTGNARFCRAAISAGSRIYVHCGDCRFSYSGGVSAA
jgi:hypothetical protein